MDLLATDGSSSTGTETGEPCCVLCQGRAEVAGAFCSDSCAEVSGEVLRLLRQRHAHVAGGAHPDFSDAVQAAIELAGLHERIEELSAARRRAVALSVPAIGPPAPNGR